MNHANLRKDDRGAIMLLALIFALFGIGILYSIVGVSQAAIFRAKMQDGADAAALSGALMQARTMNLLVLLNIVMAALLSVLVALKMVEALAIGGALVSTALSYPTMGTSLAFVPPFEAIRQNVKAAHDNLEPPITQAIEAVKTLSDNVVTYAADNSTGVAKSAASGPVDITHASMREGLPVEDDEPEVLCGKAAALPAVIANEVLPMPGFFEDALDGAMETLGETFANWFCGTSGSDNPPAIDLTSDVWYPSYEMSEDCQESGKAIAEEDWASLDPETTSACAEEAGEAAARAVNNETGACTADCEPNGAYEMHAQLARETCQPGGDFTKWAYLSRTGTVEYIWTGDAWERQEPVFPPESQFYQPESMFPPCGEHAFQKDPRLNEWNLTMRPEGEEGPVTPVCSTEDDLRPLLRPGARAPESVIVEFTEVTHVLGCARKETLQAEIEGEGSGTSDDRASKRVTEGLEMGNEEFQIRVAAEGSPMFESTQRVVKLALFGKDEIPSGVESLKQYSGVHVAQAEFFFDGDVPEEEWMWSMSWNARITRFKAEGEGFEGLLTACDDAPTRDHCAPALELIEEFPAVVTH